MTKKKLSAAQRRKAEARDKFLAAPCAPITVLAVDAAASSGWAIAAGLHGKLEIVDSGLVEIYSEPRGVEQVIERATAAARHLSLPLAGAIEYQAAPYGGRDVRSFAGVCEARGPWRRQWSLMIADLARGDNPRVGRRPMFSAGRFAKVPVGTWRSMILGPIGRLDRAQLKELAMAEVLHRHGIRATDDEAEALLIAEYVLRLEGQSAP